MTSEKLWYKSYPHNVPTTLPSLNMSLGEILTTNAKDYPDKPALLLAGKKFRTTRISYSQLDILTTNFAKNLYQLGLRRGDRIAIFLPNFPDFVIAFFGIQKLGAIAVPLNVLFSSHELEYHLKDSGAKVIITIDVKTINPSFLETVHEAVNKVPTVEHIIVCSISKYLSKVKGILAKLVGKITPLDKEDLVFENLLKDNDIELPSLEVDPLNDVAIIPYTGGTTGTPKGVMLTHDNVISNANAAWHWMIPMYNGLPKKGEFKILTALPLFHTFGSTVDMIVGVLIAAELILVPNPRERKFTELLELIQEYKPNLFPFVPTGYIALLNHPKINEFDLSSLQFCLSGAAPLPVEVMKQFQAVSGSMVVEGWGLTETSPIACANPITKIKPGSIGIPFIDIEVGVFDVNDKNKRITEINEIGELGIKGPIVMKGYWNKPKETENVMNNEGFFMSGDIGYMDEDGYFYISDRKKNMIIVSGYKIFPREVEEVFYTHPDVRAVAIIGVPDEYRGEQPKAFVVLKEGSTTTVDDLHKFAKENLAKYKVPKEIVIRNSLPTSAVGKVLHRALRDEERSKKKEN